MATYAKIGLSSQIIDVIEVENNACLDADGNFDENVGAEFLANLYKWPTSCFKRADQNTRNKIHYDRETNEASADQSKAFRKHCAELGGTYDSVRDVFLPKQPYASWTFNYSTWYWEPPVEKPADVVDGVPRIVRWNEETISWDVINS